MAGFLLYTDQQSVDVLLHYLDIDHGYFCTEDFHSADFDTRPAVIQWGNPCFPQNNTPFPVLNAAEGLHNCDDSSTMAKILKCNGIPVSLAKEQTIRRYFAVVFQQDVISLYRSKGRKAWLSPVIQSSSDDAFEEIAPTLNQREVRRVIRLATRAIYALGLDFGGVMFGINHSGKVKVLYVTPTPKLNEALAEKMAERFRKYIDSCERREGSQAVLGADPEFVLRESTSGTMVLASKYFKKRGIVGCDSISLREDQTRTQHPLAELRPQPDTNPRQLVINIYKAMLSGVRLINQPTVEWLAGGMPLQGYPIGGHIHFSQVWLNSQLLRVLDNYLALPMVLIESKESLQRRPRYGYLGDIRRQFHGGFEYRTLPSWLIAPRLTKGVISLAKLITSNHLAFTYFPLFDYEMQRAFYQGNKVKLKPVVEQIIWKIKSLPSYGDYAAYLEPFFETVLSGVEWNEHQDIRAAWKLPPYHN